MEITNKFARTILKGQYHHTYSLLFYSQGTIGFDGTILENDQSWLITMATLTNIPRRHFTLIFFIIVNIHILQTVITIITSWYESYIDSNAINHSPLTVNAAREDHSASHLCKIAHL